MGGRTNENKLKDLIKIIIGLGLNMPLLLINPI